MYAVIRAGGKQYRVAPGDVIEIEKLPQTSGENVQFDDVLAVSATEGEIAKPAAAFVSGQVVRLPAMRCPVDDTTSNISVSLSIPSFSSRVISSDKSVIGRSWKVSISRFEIATILLLILRSNTPKVAK